MFNPRILIIHNYSTVHGGADHTAVKQMSALIRRGHEVAFFSAEDDLGLLDFRARNALRYIYNKKAAEKMAFCIEQFKPDIAHCHNIYGHLTPSILKVLRRYRVPVVMTLHDWKLICPNHRLFVNGAICERCKVHRYYHSFIHRCFKGSYAASFMGMVEAYVNYIFKLYKNNIDVLISPSMFLKEKFIEFGWSSDRIKVVPIYVPIDFSFEPVDPGKRDIVYFGKMSYEKGITTLLQAIRLMAVPVSLKLIGEEPDPKTRDLAGETGHDVEFLPFQNTAQLYQSIQSALFTVVPSLWYENQPATILESYSLARAVVGSNHGGIAELIEDQKTGLLFRAGDPHSLAAKMNELLNDPQKAIKMGEEGRRKVEREFNEEIHCQRLMEVYKEVLRCVV